MPKSKNDLKEKTAKLIYQNSRNTINTYSKTYSGASQLFTKSLILQLKQNLHNEDYYEENGTVKRDLSIATDICILRGYYKKKRNKLINRETVSTKSKYSFIHTEIDHIDKFKYDGSACGDSKGSLKLKDTHFNMNLTSLVVQHLNKMLSNWITKYLLDNDKTKQKIESVLDSLLHKIDLQQKETVSSCTYTVDIELYQKQQGKHIISHSMTSHGIKQGSFSIPLDGKSYRVLSTLSVPKNIHRRKTSNYSWKKINKIRHRKILLSTNGSSKYLFTSSSLNFLTLPTQFLTKCCATYQQDIYEKKREKQETLFLKDDLSSIKNLDSFTAKINKLKNINNATNAQNSAFNTIPSIYKNIYDGLKHNEIHGSRNIHQNGNTVHEQENCVPLVPIDVINGSFNIADSNNQKNEDSDLIRESFNKKHKKVTKRNKKIISRLIKHKCIKSKLITSPKYEDYVKLDIQVNVFPSSNYTAEKDAVNTCKYSQPLLYADTTPHTEIIKNNLVSRDHNIIPLLDGAISQAKYLVSGEISTKSSVKDNPVDSPAIDYITKESQIAQEIGELKLIIKTLANTTEKLVNEHLNKISFCKDISKPHSINKTKKYHEDLENICKPSIGVQISSKCVKDGVIGSGIKLKKDPKKKRRYHPRLSKKSTSYNIIDSESILKVTDMTSAAQGEINVRCKVDRALTCSLPKTKSLYEVSVGTNDEKIIDAFDHRNEICDELIKPGDFIYNVCELKPYTSNPDKTQYVKPAYNETKIRTEQNIEDSEVLPLDNGYDSINSGSTVCIDIETKMHDKKITIRHTGVTCWGGCFYCILLWIPLLSIVWFFYKYVLKDYLPENFPLQLIWTEGNIINESYFRLTLADLGF